MNTPDTNNSGTPASSTEASSTAPAADTAATQVAATATESTGPVVASVEPSADPATDPAALTSEPAKGQIRLRIKAEGVISAKSAPQQSFGLDDTIQGIMAVIAPDLTTTGRRFTIGTKEVAVTKKLGEALDKAGINVKDNDLLTFNVTNRSSGG